MAEITIYSSNYCPYCMKAKHLLKTKSVSFNEIVVDGKPEVRREMMVKSQQRTVPQIWIGSVHVGGCDDLFALEGAGKLDSLLADG